MDKKLIDLESKFSFQEDLLNELNNAVVRQQKQINHLIQDVSQIKSHILEIVDSQSVSGGQDSKNEIPPHY
ncbi:MAG: SlyX family protein [Gammaproteobacteria bacterium]|jgi:SlyX protein|nr:SlyX family protein [Gammaproteobacteria bacterium]